MKKKKLFKIILISIAIIIIVILGWKLTEKNKNIETKNNTPFFDTKILGNSKDLVSFSVSPGDSVSGILNVTGSVQGGYFFEANIQVNILDSNKKLLRAGNGNAKTEWMTSDPVGFDAVLDFTKLHKGPAYIEIHNDNPAGPNEGVNKSILIPIIIK